MTTIYPPLQVVFTLTKTMDVVTMREFVRLMVCEPPLGTRSPESEVILPVMVFKVTVELEIVPEPYSKPYT